MRKVAQKLELAIKLDTGKKEQIDRHLGGDQAHSHREGLSYAADLIFELQLLTAAMGFMGLSEKLSSAHMEALHVGSRLRQKGSTK